MKCEDCLKIIEEYFDGELSDTEAIGVGAHVSTCNECARRLEDLRDEQNLYALYRRDVEVSPALWTRVAAEIREEARRREASARSGWGARLGNLFGAPRLSPAFAFALVVLAVGATAGVMKLIETRMERDNPPAVSQSQAPTAPATRNINRPVNETSGQKETVDNKTTDKSIATAEDPVEKTDAAPRERVMTVKDVTEARRASSKTESFYAGETPDQLVREAEQKYQAAIRLLTRDAKRRRSMFDSDVLARFDQTLATVDSTIAETRRAVRRQPDDPVAVQYMLAAYAKKVEVLKEMATYRAYDGGIQ